MLYPTYRMDNWTQLKNVEDNMKTFGLANIYIYVYACTLYPKNMPALTCCSLAKTQPIFKMLEWLETGLQIDRSSHEINALIY